MRVHLERPAPSDLEGLDAILETARRFADREIAPMVGAEERDGDLSRLGALLEKAGETGLLASARPEAAGFDHGVWGGQSHPALSAAVLEELARACAGVAACVHFAGLGAAEVAGATIEDPPALAAVALFEPPGLLDLARPPALAASPDGAGFVLRGEKVFVQSAPSPDGFAVFAGGPAPGVYLVPAGSDGLSARDAGAKTGLAALATLHFRLEGVRLPAVARLGRACPERFLARAWLGLSAIALGNARGALGAAKRYAADRYQGGRSIAGHPAVRQLLADAESRIESTAAHLASVAARAPGAPPREAAILKLRSTLECAEAVSDCLQVLGGYGYMEDYRLEKRLRDALTLKSMAGRPDDLRLAIAAAPEAP